MSVGQSSVQEKKGLKSEGGSRQTMKNDPNKGSVYTIYFIVYTIHTRPCFGDVIGKSHCLQKNLLN